MCIPDDHHDHNLNYAAYDYSQKVILCSNCSEICTRGFYNFTLFRVP